MSDKHHDATPLMREEAEKLYDGIRFIEGKEEDKKDIADEIKERKALITSQLPINGDVLDFVLKRRKASGGTRMNFDTMLEHVEEAIAKIEGEHADDVRAQIEKSWKKGGQEEFPSGDVDDDIPA